MAAEKQTPDDVHADSARRKPLRDQLPRLKSSGRYWYGDLSVRDRVREMERILYG